VSPRLFASIIGAIAILAGLIVMGSEINIDAQGEHVNCGTVFNNEGDIAGVSQDDQLGSIVGSCGRVQGRRQQSEDLDDPSGHRGCCGLARRHPDPNQAEHPDTDLRHPPSWPPNSAGTWPTSMTSPAPGTVPTLAVVARAPRRESMGAPSHRERTHRNGSQAARRAAVADFYE
jgi:hypothetical protein